jgi:NADH-quinone oxidoreductase subunit M
MVGLLSDRRHTRLIAEYGGLKAVTPQLVRVFLLITLASIALPLTNGFIGEFLILLGAFRWNVRLASFAATGVILSAVYMLWMFQRVNYGTIRNEKNRALPDLTPREWVMVAPIAAMAIFMGVMPNVFLRPMEPSVRSVLERITGQQPAQVHAAPPTVRELTDLSGTTAERRPPSAARQSAERRAPSAEHRSAESNK